MVSKIFKKNEKTWIVYKSGEKVSKTVDFKPHRASIDKVSLQSAR